MSPMLADYRLELPQKSDALSARTAFKGLILLSGAASQSHCLLEQPRKKVSLAMFVPVLQIFLENQHKHVPCWHAGMLAC